MRTDCYKFNGILLGIQVWMDAWNAEKAHIVVICIRISHEIITDFRSTVLCVH